MEKRGRETTRSTSLFDLLRSVRLSILLLILLALTSIVGTLIKQNAPPLEYIEQFGTGLYRFLNFLGFFDMYHSWWFRGILGILAINIFSCSSSRFPRIWREITRRQSEMGKIQSTTLPYSKELKRSLSHDEVAEKTSSITRGIFGKSLLSETPEAIAIFAERGRMSRLGVSITHLSILIILLGALIGSLFGFKGFVNILEGETVDRVFTRQRHEATPRPLGFKVRCDDFRITYYDTNTQERLVKEYISTLTFLEDGREVMKKEVRVNHPLTFNGLRFYQASYGDIPEITVTVENKSQGEHFSLVAYEGERVGIPESKAFFQILKFQPQIHNLGQGIAMAFFQPMAMPQRFWLLKARPKLVGGYQFTLKDVIQREYTGLQVMKDPGVWIVWLGCILLVWGLIVTFFFSHQRIWVLIPRRKATILVSGTTNKNRIAFERRFHKTIAALERKV
ncbi:MAG: cytochrome c biogenesis protein ResB [Thermodesulfobacteriota bacterium]